MLDLAKLAYGNKDVVLSSDELQRILIKMKLKKSQASSSREAEMSQGKALERALPNRSQMEVVEVGG